jgi:MoxR-like ATPase
MREVILPNTSPDDSARDLPEEYTSLVLDALMLALSGRIFLDEALETTPEAVLREIWQKHFFLHPTAAQPG